MIALLGEIRVKHCPGIASAGRGAARPPPWPPGRRSRPAAPDRPAIAEIRVGDQIIVAGGRRPLVVIVRQIGTVPGGRVLHLEVPGLPQFSWAVRYSDTERVERHAAGGWAA